MVISVHSLRRLALAAAALFALTAGGCGGRSGGDPITTDELLDRINGGSAPYVLDVRAAGEFETIRIAGAVNIPHYQLDGRISELPDPSTEIVLVDQKGGRSRAARNILEAAGFENLRELEGHMFQWVMQKYPVEH